MTMKYSEYFKSRQTEPLSAEDIKFCHWIDCVEKIVLRETKQHLLDLNDEMYMVNFEQGRKPSEMADIVIQSFRSWWH